MKKTHYNLISIIALTATLLPLHLFAQTENQYSNNMNTLPEEIVISGERFSYQIREQIMDAEEDMYGMFNDLNDEKRFEISCRTNDRLGSNISKRLCLPKFYTDATSHQGQDYLAEFRSNYGGPGELPAGSAPRGTGLPTAIIVNIQQEELQEKMQKIARENPDFLEALIKYVELKEQYERSLQ